MIPAKSITDQQRHEFLFKLGKSDLLLTEWEDRFVKSFFAGPGTTRWFTDGRRQSTDKMWMKYGAELKMPFPVAARADARPTKIPDADPNGCQFLIYDGGRPNPCNEPATKMRRNGFGYCDSHAEQVRRDCQRRGKTIELFDFQPKEAA
jgi:hypothetical protein